MAFITAIETLNKADRETERNLDRQTDRHMPVVLKGESEEQQQRRAGHLQKRCVLSGLSVSASLHAQVSPVMGTRARSRGEPTQWPPFNRITFLSPCLSLFALL